MAEAITGGTGGGGAGEFGDGDELSPASAARKPVSPEHEWRARAVAAEEGLKQARAALEQLQSQFDEHKSQAAAGERRRQINAAATQASAVDVELVAMLVEAQLAESPDAEVVRVIADLKRSKPFLFAGGDSTVARQGSAASTAAGAAAATPANTRESLSRKAEEARSTGDRRALLGYLRARRGG